MPIENTKKQEKKTTSKLPSSCGRYLGTQRINWILTLKMPSFRVASLYLFLGYIFPQPDEAAKTISLFAFHLKSHEPTSWSDRNICLAVILTRLHNSSLLGFLGLPQSLQPRKVPFISKASWPICKCFSVAEGQKKPDLAMSCSAQQALCPALTMLQRVHFFGCCLVGQRHLDLEQRPSPSLRSPASSGESWPQIPLQRGKMGLMNCPGLILGMPGFKPSCLSYGLLCPGTRMTVWNTETVSLMDGLLIREYRALCFICCPSGIRKHALVRSLHFTASLVLLLFQTPSAL